jgi:hypothetical protein
MEPKQYTVVQLDWFVRSWERLGLNDDDMLTLEEELRRRALSAPVIPGSGGARKLRFAPPSLGRGKRGGARVVFLMLHIGQMIVLIEIYAKGERADISADELAAIKTRIENIAREIRME